MTAYVRLQGPGGAAISTAMEIRSEIPSDEQAISTVITAAFLGAEHSGGNEAKIVEVLRSARALAVSLVATDEERIVGHVAFSPVTIDGRSDSWFGLGPVAVVPSRQGEGIGSALIEAGLTKLRARGSKGCVVLGEQAYYGRFGFTAGCSLHLAGVPPQYFQQLKFKDHPCGGMVKYHAAFEIA
jgi:putative acetyltransferase